MPQHRQDFYYVTVVQYLHQHILHYTRLLVIPMVAAGQPLIFQICLLLLMFLLEQAQGHL